ncbi:unnamed protein product, partial [Mycena citricolor]
MLPRTTVLTMNTAAILRVAFRTSLLDEGRRAGPDRRMPLGKCRPAPGTSRRVYSLALACWRLRGVGTGRTGIDPT